MDLSLLRLSIFIMAFSWRDELLGLRIWGYSSNISLFLIDFSMILFMKSVSSSFPMDVLLICDRTISIISSHFTFSAYLSLSTLQAYS